MQYLLSHRTSYSYASTVDSAQHIAHLRARPFPGQTVKSIGITTSPEPKSAQTRARRGRLVDGPDPRPDPPRCRPGGV